MTMCFCPRCNKDYHITKLKFGRLLRKNVKEQWAVFEGLCPKCGLFINESDILCGVTKKEFKKCKPAPKNYQFCFPETRVVETC